MDDDDLAQRAAEERRRALRRRLVEENAGSERQVPMAAGGEVRMFTTGAAFYDDPEDHAPGN